MRSTLLLFMLVLAISPAWSQGFWEELDGPPGDNINESAEVKQFIVPKDGGVFACLDDGVVVSYDNGLTWERRTNGLPPDRLDAIAADSNGTLIAVSYIHGAFRSTDGGRLWSSLNSGIDRVPAPYDRYDLMDITYNQHNNSWYIASSGSRVLVSQDQGDSWNTSILDTLNGRFVSILTAPNGNVVVGGQFGTYTYLFDSGMWKSSEGGAMSLSSAASGRIYSIGGSWSFSDDGGETWSDWQPGPEQLYVRDVFDLGNHGLFACAENMFMMSYCFRSMDSGRTWTVVEDLTRYHSYIEDMIALPAGNMLAGDYYTIYRSDTAGNDWTGITDGVQRQEIYDALLLSDGRLLAGAMWDMYSHDLLTGEWSRLLDWSAFTLVEHTDGVLLGQTWPGIRRSADSGKSWESIVLGHNQASFLIKNSSEVLYCGFVDSTIFRSHDAGETWEPGTLRMEYRTVPDGEVADDGSLLLLADGEGVIRVDSALSSMRTLLPQSETGYLTSLARTNSDAILVSAWNGVFRSTDSGASWDVLPSPDQGHAVPWFMDTDRTGRIYCLFRIYEDTSDLRTYTGMLLYSTSDFGLTWEPIELPQPYQWYSFMEVLSDSRLYLASRVEGLFRSCETVVSVRETPVAVPGNTVRAYPQPADEQATISWNSRNASACDIALFDRLGRNVMRTHRSFHVSGLREFRLDTGNFRPGVYFVVINDGDGVHTGRVVVR